jgi:hypothetical protein
MSFLVPQEERREETAFGTARPHLNDGVDASPFELSIKPLP